MVLTAAADGDKDRARRIGQACPTKIYRMADADYLDRLEHGHSLCKAVIAHFRQYVFARRQIEGVKGFLCGKVAGMIASHASTLSVSAMLKDEGLTELFEDLEMPLMPVLAEMERSGILVDPARLKRQETELSGRADKLRDRVLNLAGHPFNVDSPKQLAEVLFEEMDYLPLNEGIIVPGERIRTVWVFPPPVQAERARPGVPVFNGAQPVVGIDVRALSISPRRQ